MVGEDGEHVGADFVGGIAVGGDAVGSGDDEVDFSGAHKGCGGTIGDALEGDVVVEEFVGGEAQALLAGSGFAGVDVFDYALLMGGADDAEGGSVTGGGEGACVADSEDGGALGNESGTKFPDFLVHGEVFGFDCSGFGKDVSRGFVGEGVEAVERPEKIDGGGAGGGKFLPGLVPVGLVVGGESHSVSGGDSNCGGSADGHVADRFGDFGVCGVGDPDGFGGEDALIEEVEGVVFEFDAAEGMGHVFLRLPRYKAFIEPPYPFPSPVGRDDPSHNFAMRVLIFEDNLIWSERLRKSVVGLGHEAVVVSRLRAELPEGNVAILNLGSETLWSKELVAGLKANGVYLIGHAGHKEKQKLEAGREEGLDKVATNSQLTFKLDQILGGLDS